MRATTSVYLDAARFLAACVVFVGHMAGTRFTAGLAWQASLYMDDCVAVFFVLSGYVIALVVEGREGAIGPYALGRAARILSVAVPALVATFALDALGRLVSPAAYDPSWGYPAASVAAQVLLPATFTAQVWGLDVSPGSDLPWWSLCYEAWYYGLFAALLFGGRRRWLLVVAGLVAAGPAIAAMFPLWLAGVGLRRVSARIPAGWSGSFVLGPVVFFSAVAFVSWAHLLPSTTVPGLTKHLDPLRAYLAGAVFALSVLAVESAGQAGWTARSLAAIRGPVRAAASITFTLYLVHLPVAQAIASVGGLPPASLAGRLAVLGGTALAMVPFAWVGEWRKAAWGRMLGRCSASLCRALAMRGASVAARRP